MRDSKLTAAIIATGIVSLSGCAWVGEQVLNKEIGDGAGGAVSDMVRTAGDISDENQQERAETLSSEYQDFLDAQISESRDEDDQGQSIMMKPDEAVHGQPPKRP